MASAVSIQIVTPRILAAVRKRVTVSGIATVWRPALDEVWVFLRAHPDLREGGHNVFLYHHPAQRDDPMDIDFGVQVVREFAPSGEVRPVWTPPGRAAVATHRGPYDRLGQTHDAIHAWAESHGETFAGTSWEIYGDSTPDLAKTETTVMYLLR